MLNYRILNAARAQVRYLNYYYFVVHKIHFLKELDS